MSLERKQQFDAVIAREMHPIDLHQSMQSVIKVFGCGGGGGNVLNRVISTGRLNDDIDFFCLDTDSQALDGCYAPVKIQLNSNLLTRGTGTGGNLENGKKAAEELKQDIHNAIHGGRLLVIVTYLGGGTGTSCAPVVSRIGREMGCLTVAFAILPSDINGSVVLNRARIGMEELRKHTDQVIVFSNDKMFDSEPQELTVEEAYGNFYSVFTESLKAVLEIVTCHGIENLDYADLESVLKDSNGAFIGIGYGNGDDRAVEAVENVFENPYLNDNNPEGCTKMLVNIASKSPLLMTDFKKITSEITKRIKPAEDYLMKFGRRTDENLNEELKITLIATDFDNKNSESDRKKDEENIRPESTPQAEQNHSDNLFVDEDSTFDGWDKNRAEAGLASSVPPITYQKDQNKSRFDYLKSPSFLRGDKK